MRLTVPERKKVWIHVKERLEAEGGASRKGVWLKGRYCNYRCAAHKCFGKAGDRFGKLYESRVKHELYRGLPASDFYSDSDSD